APASRLAPRPRTPWTSRPLWWCSQRTSACPSSPISSLSRELCRLVNAMTDQRERRGPMDGDWLAQRFDADRAPQRAGAGAIVAGRAGRRLRGAAGLARPGCVPAGASTVARGAAAVTQVALQYRWWSAQPALVNGAAGLVSRLHGRP